MTGPGGRKPHAAGPWQQGQLAGLCLAQAVALVLVILASVASGRTGHLSTQSAWVAVATAGLAVAGVTGAGWVLSGNRRLVRRRVQLSRETVRTFARRESPGDNDAQPVAGANMSHYHRRDCALVRGKDVRAEPVLVHGRAGRTPCAVCRP